METTRDNQGLALECVTLGQPWDSDSHLHEVILCFAWLCAHQHLVQEGRQHFYHWEGSCALGRAVLWDALQQWREGKLQ